jgi:hypothetical protein
MSQGGVFAVCRGIWDHPTFKPEPYTEREAWLWMISAAAWKPTRVRVGRCVLAVNRGELGFATRFLATKFRWSESRIRRFLKRLEADEMVLVSTTRDATHVTLCNYDKYAFGRRADDALPDARSDDMTTHPRRKEEELKNLRTEVGPPIVPQTGDAPATDQPKVDKAAKPKRAQKRSTPWPEGFALDDVMREFADKRGWATARQDHEFEKFHADAQRHGKLFKDWRAGWRTWVLHGIGYDAQRGGAPIAPVAPIDPASIDWNEWVAKFKSHNIWPAALGPRPGSAGCKAPLDLVSQMLPAQNAR